MTPTPDLVRFNSTVDVIQLGYLKTDRLPREFPVSGDALAVNQMKVKR